MAKVKFVQIHPKITAAAPSPSTATVSLHLVNATHINDADESSKSAWSSSKIVSWLNSKLEPITSSLAKRLRFDAPQDLTSAEKANARSSLGLGELATQDTIQDATIAQKGVVQLDDAYADSEALAATARSVKLVKTTADAAIAATEKGAANGVAPLDADSKIPSQHLPSFVDDVLEFANFSALPSAGETGKIYIALDTNLSYRWSGSAYVNISSGGIADSALKLNTARTINLSGDAAGSVNFDGSQDVTLNATLTTVPVAKGGTGATKAAAARTNLGLGTAATKDVGKSTGQLILADDVAPVLDAQTRLITDLSAFPNVYVDSQGVLRQTQQSSFFDHQKMYNGLFANGSGQMGGLQNFGNDFTRNDDKPFGCECSFAYSGAYKAWFSEDFIAVDANQVYRFRASCKYLSKITKETKLYIGVVEYDIDKKLLHVHLCIHVDNTLTTLAQDLKPNDTEVYITGDLSRWDRSGLSYNKGIKFYTYRDSTGFLYKGDEVPYSRYYKWNLWDETTAFDDANKKITLTNPWDYPNPDRADGVWLAGTQIAQTDSGASFNYILSGFASYQTGETDWHTTVKTLTGMSLNGMPNSTKFRAGTSYLKVIGLLNLGGSPTTDDIILLSNIWVDRL